MKKTGKSRRCTASREWAKRVYDRDGNRCQNCGSKENLNAHHINRWKDFPDLRFEINNGITYCRSCHHKIEKTGKIAWNKGKKTSDDTKIKQSNARLGKTPWNKGKTTTLPAYRICKMCTETKKIFEFTPLERGKFYTHVCKLCRNKVLRENQNITVV